MANKTAGYVRCSTVEQNDSLQRRAITAWAKANSLTVRWYADKATGTNGNRPGWRKLQEAIRQGKVDTVVCWKLDRLARSLKDAAGLFDDLAKRGIRLVSLTEGVDLSTAAGRMLAGVLATFAEFENAIRRERQVAGIKAAKAKGKTWGGQAAGFWSKLTMKQKAEIRRLHKTGISKSALARQYRLSWPTVHGIIG